MRPAAPWQTEQVSVDHESAVGHATATVRNLARQLGLGPPEVDRAAVVAAELASNLSKHASGGVLLLGPSPGQDALDLWAVDRGPGMTNVGRCLGDGYSTTGTMGTGLGAVRRMADEFAVWSRPAHGTAVFARLAVPRPVPRNARDLDGAAICLPAREDDVTGDGYSVSGDGRTVAIIDGLGHGPEAAAATARAIAAFRAHSGLPLPALLTELHEASRGTRGCAALLVRIGPGNAEICGVGNTSGAILAEGKCQALLGGQPGTLGVRIPSLQTARLRCAPGALLVLHTDGIRTRWPASMDPEQLSQPPALLTALLAAGSRRARDDSTVLTLRLP